MSVAETIAARIATETASADAADAAAETDVSAAPVAENASNVAAGAENQELDEKATKRAILQAKLDEVTNRRREAKHSNAARAEREAAAADRKAAAAERSRWEALKTGSFKEGIEASGRDPRVVFAEMQREAIEANTPEAEMKRMRADFERQMGEKLAPLQQTIEELKRERETYAARAHEGTLSSAFQRDVQDPAYQSLRTEYADSALMEYVKHFDKNPNAFYAEAKKYQVRLTDPQRGFTMREILDVLKSAQDEHDRGRQARAAKLAPPVASGKTPSVNGTVARPNAGTTIGNDLATERASTGRRLSRYERVEAEIERLSKG